MDSLNCPLTCDIFRDPVIGVDGHTYERKDIIAWLQQHGTSPITREPMSVDSLRPNHIVRKMIEEFTAVSLRQNYQFRLNIDVRKSETRPWFIQYSKAIYKAEWITKQGPPIVLIEIDGAQANREAQFYVQLSCHPHIVRTFGLVESDPNSVLLVQECAEKGDLTTMLREKDFKPTRNVLIEIFNQIVDAMICLADNGIVHGDLSCRNVLVFRCSSNVPEETLVKLTDFGLTKGSDLFSVSASSSQTTMSVIPTRYAAPEILQAAGDGIFYSEKSDIYSMGVLMWEACSYGTLPFASLADDSDVCRYKLGGAHLPRPAVCDEELWSTIIHCWKLQPNERPTFKELRWRIMRLVHRSDSRMPNPVSVTEKVPLVPYKASLASEANAELLLSRNYDNPKDKIPCEFCEKLIHFDQYIAHTQVCAHQQTQSVVKEDRPVQSIRITTTTQSPVPFEASGGRDSDKIKITVVALSQSAKSEASSMDYRVTTKNSLTVLKKTYFIVNRNFADFLVLHGKLVAKHLPRGIIVPPLPEKSSSVRLKNVTERRRAGLERYLNRLARKEVLHGDSDFELFIEHTSELPKITNDSWRRLLCTSTARLQDGDWFDKKQRFIINFQTDLRVLKSNFDHSHKQRVQFTLATEQLAFRLNHLATVEEDSSLAEALFELSIAQTKLQQIHSDHTDQEFCLMNEMVNEYLLQLDMVNYAFHERVKVHQSYAVTVEILKKKLNEKGHQAEREAHELRTKMVSDMEHYEEISITLKQELEIFEQDQIQELKNNILTYMKQACEQQEKVLELWQAYLPIAKNIIRNT